MSEHCHDALECRPEDLRCALSIHTQKITDSCRDKDCIEDLRVYLTRESQAVLDTAGLAKVRSAELIYTAMDVSPVAFHRNHYTIDLTFYYKVIADAAVGPCRPAAICGLALFSKRAVLCGENSGAHIFRSDCPGTTAGSLPTAVVEAMDTNSLCSESCELDGGYELPRLSSRKGRGTEHGHGAMIWQLCWAAWGRPIFVGGLCEKVTEFFPDFCYYKLTRKECIHLPLVSHGVRRI